MMKVLKGCGSLVIAGFVILFVIGLAAGSKTENASTAPAASSTPKDAASSAPPVELSPVEKFEANLSEELGDLNRDGQRINLIDYDEKSKELMVKFALNDNFSNHLIVVGAWGDFADTITAIRSSGLEVKTLYVFGSLPFQDDLGNPTGERDVVGATFLKRALDGANLENLPGEMLQSAADDWWVNPQLQD